MKATGLKHLLRSIRKSGVSFLAVAVIAGVSIAIFQGFQSSAHAILRRADAYFVENRLESLEISCANGITDEDIEAISAWDGVRSAEGGYTDAAQLELDGERVLVQVRSLLESMNDAVIVKGELPTAADEAAIEELLASEKGISVGDTITLQNDGCLLGTQFTVTGIINLPVYCCSGLEDTRGSGVAGLGSNEYFIAFDKSAFDSDNYSGCYTTAYISLTTDCIMKNHGTLDKFVGDCTMAIWNAPIEQEDYVMNACKAAVDMVEGSKALSQELLEKFGRTVSFGIGVHCGSAVVGNIGAEMRMDFTAIGDTVNTSARLEANAPAGKIYISRDVVDRLGSRILTTSLGDGISLKGKSNKFEIFLLDGIAEG